MLTKDSLQDFGLTALLCVDYAETPKFKSFHTRQVRKRC